MEFAKNQFIHSANVKKSDEATIETNSAAEIVGLSNDLRSALEKGIEIIGVGKIGSKNCSAELVDQLVMELKKPEVDQYHVAAFLGALWMKGLSKEEEKLRVFNPCDFFQNFPKQLKELFLIITQNENLSDQQAQILAEFLMSIQDQSLDPIRLLLTAALRIRHAQTNEYVAIYQELKKSFPHWCHRVFETSHRQLIQISNPTDGFDRSMPILPLLTEIALRYDMNCVIPVAPSSGPKFGYNDFHLAEQLQLPFIENQQVIDHLKQPQAYYYHLHQLSSVMDHWHFLRQKMKKRPFMATLEKLVNPFCADYLITSVFHGGFNEKMLEVAQKIGYKKIIIIFRGVEGSLCLSIARSTKVLYSYQTDQGYETKEINFNPIDYGFVTMIDPKIDSNEIARFSQQIQKFQMDGIIDDHYQQQRILWNRMVFDQLMQLLLNSPIV